MRIIWSGIRGTRGEGVGGGSRGDQSYVNSDTDRVRRNRSFCARACSVPSSMLGRVRCEVDWRASGTEWAILAERSQFKFAPILPRLPMTRYALRISARGPLREFAWILRIRYECRNVVITFAWYDPLWFRWPVAWRYWKDTGRILGLYQVYVCLEGHLRIIFVGSFFRAAGTCLHELDGSGLFYGICSI